MKRFRRILTIALVMALVVSCMPVSAAPRNSSTFSNTRTFSFGDWFASIWDKYFGNNETETEETNDTTTLSLVEDSTTVENGDMLRASTYSLSTTSADESATPAIAAYALNTADEDGTTYAANSSTVKYFPVTMYDYDADTINAATDALDDDLTVREGMYFSSGSPDSIKGTTLENGKYYIQNIRASENNVGSWLSGADDSIKSVTNQNSATLWTLTNNADGTIYLKDADEKYLVVGNGGTTGAGDGLSDSPVALSLSAFSENENGVQIVQTVEGRPYYLCQWGSTISLEYGGYSVNNDGGNGMLFYPVDDDGNVSTIPATLSEGSIVSGYEAWNRWDKATNDSAYGDLFYTGLVQKTLVDDQIVFNVNEGGIFNSNSDVKDIYEYVGLPFIYIEGWYTFDSDTNGAYFADTNSDDESDPQSGTETAPYNLYFDEGNTQGWDGMNNEFGDGSVNLWAPFNTNENDTGQTAINYYFGMRADIPFSMTANGRVKSTDDTSTPISFNFSGDDDVWVFIDGNLVVDLGGIHNRLDVTIDFAANTVTYSEENSFDDNKTTGSFNDDSFATTQKLFTDSEGTGLINMSRDAFAANEDHEMSVFYLERGAGTSNCQIKFNLPMHDTVLVTKNATQSWNPNTDEVEDLTESEQAIVDNINFGFTLYKKTADENSSFVPVANTNFYLIDDETGTVISNTDANGHFYLKNGQTAKFITDIPEEGVTYYVVEDAVPDGFVTPDFNYDGEATYGYTYIDANGTVKEVASGNEIPEQIIAIDGTVNKSYEVTAMGSVEANDSLEFICSNYLNATIPNPSIYPNEDIIVIDYGLPVQIDPLANDLFRGDTIEILYVGGENVIVTETEDEDGIKSAKWTTDDTIEFGTVKLVKGTETATDNSRDTLVYTLNKPLTEVEVLTYVVRVTGNYTNEATDGTVTQTSTKTGKIYIVPATSMYYEENFSGLVTFTGSGWKGVVKEDAYVSAFQEPGVVGTTTDSTYGSDVAYLKDSADSNGTSYKGDTTNGAIRFTYTFTGTGTSIFARTSESTGYMQIKLYEGTDSNGNLESITYRDTYYKDENTSSNDADGTLYNVPVYTDELDYGTYTVVVTVAKAGTAAAGGANGSGNEFYLDGIRIMEPLNTFNETVINETTGETITDKALAAYATDGEANMEVVTLRNKLITDDELGTTPWNFAVLTDTDGGIITADDYKSIGPKEEVYLEAGQSVSFTLKYWQTDGLMLYLGMKAPFGSATAQVGQTTYNLANATDCYYEITSDYSSLITKYEQAVDENDNLLYKDEEGNQVYEDGEGVLRYVESGNEVGEDAVLTPVDDMSQPYYEATFTITATDKIVSLTNIKVTGNYVFNIVENEDIYVEGDEN